MPGSQTLIPKRDEALRSVLTKTATATLTVREVLNFPVIIVNTASADVELTLPAASAALKNVCRRICAYGANGVSVLVAAGFGAGGESYDYATIGCGGFMDVFCDGTRWYAGGEVAAAGDQ